jgi:hypothetical protein
MEFTPNPQQMLFLWCVVTEPAGTPIKDLPYQGLQAKQRNELVERGWIQVDKIARSKRSKVNIATLTEPGWYGLEQNLQAPIAKGRATASVLQRILAGLERHIADSRISLADICGEPQEPASQTPRDVSTEPHAPCDPESVKQRIYDACRRIVGDGIYNVRIRLSELRPHLADVPRPEVDRALKELERTKAAVLNQLDDPREIRPADEAAAIDVPGGAKRHLLYLSRIH